jgi:hypothetical protein
MTASMIPFPSVRRRAYVVRHAMRVANLSHMAGEKHLAAQLKIQAETMARKGIAPGLIAADLKSLECAIRAELWRLVMMTKPGGAA